MSDTLETTVQGICQSFGNDRTRMMDIVRAVQETCGCVSGEAMNLIASNVSAHRVEVEGVVSFYAFLSSEPKGKTVIRLCNDVIDKMMGGDAVAEAIANELGIAFGETTPDGTITLEHAPCIGMCDQAPAALVNDVVVTNLDPQKARAMVQKLQADGDPKKLVEQPGDGNNSDPLVGAMVQNHIRQTGDVILCGMAPGAGLAQTISKTPEQVVEEIKNARLRGRGGAGFPTGLKWGFTAGATGDQKYVLCNADAGEPGTFKDRVILTEQPDMMFEGMTVAGYAIGSDTGIVYLRAEYAYLRAYLENVLQNRRDKGLLGQNVCGKDGFHFDIRIQMGAGAYICGEETALISSCEGLRGDPKTRPPFPAQKGYLDCPTLVNNVETFCSASRIMEKGAEWFTQMGSAGSTGTKLLSISGDCEHPGVYELEIGIRLDKLLKLCGGEDAIAVKVGGASGTLVAPDDYHKTICFDDLATGGAFMIFGPDRDILNIADEYMDFFIEESCGYCTPCRVGNVLLNKKLEEIMAGNGEPADLDYLQELAESVAMTSRCGLGQTSPNLILSTLKNFRPLYEALLKDPAEDGTQPTFDIKSALTTTETIAGRSSVHF